MRGYDVAKRDWLSRFKYKIYFTEHDRFQGMLVQRGFNISSERKNKEEINMVAQLIVCFIK